MTKRKILILAALACFAATACAANVKNYLRGGIYRNLNESLTIVGLQGDPSAYLGKDIVFSVKFHKKGSLPCPLGDDYVNLVLADRVSMITTDKAWMKKEKADALDSLGENETVVVKARVFKVDREKDPNLEVLEIAPE